MAHHLTAGPCLNPWSSQKDFRASNFAGELCMTRFRHLNWMMIAAIGLILSISHSYAQQPDVGDQPGLLADDSVELDPEYRKQTVYYRTTEPPGTIIVATAERHLYLVQGGGRALRYGI